MTRPLGLAAVLLVSLASFASATGKRPPHPCRDDRAHWPQGDDQKSINESDNYFKKAFDFIEAKGRAAADPKRGILCEQTIGDGSFDDCSAQEDLKELERAHIRKDGERWVSGLTLSSGEDAGSSEAKQGKARAALAKVCDAYKDRLAAHNAAVEQRAVSDRELAEMRRPHVNGNAPVHVNYALNQGQTDAGISGSGGRSDNVPAAKPEGCDRVCREVSRWGADCSRASALDRARCADELMTTGPSPAACGCGQ